MSWRKNVAGTKEHGRKLRARLTEKRRRPPEKRVSVRKPGNPCHLASQTWPASVRPPAKHRPSTNFESPHDCVGWLSRQAGTTLDEVIHAAAVLSADDFMAVCDTIDDVSAPNYNVRVSAIQTTGFWPDVAAVVQHDAVFTEVEDAWTFIDATIIAVNRVTGTAWALTSTDQYRGEDEPQVLQTDKLAPVCDAFNAMWREGERAREAIFAEERQEYAQALAEEEALETRRHQNHAT